MQRLLCIDAELMQIISFYRSRSEICQIYSDPQLTQSSTPEIFRSRRQGMQGIQKLSYLKMRMTSVTPNDPEVIRQIGQGLEGASDAEQMVEDIAKIGELWISARVRCQDIAPKMLRAQWAKMVQEAVHTQVKTINGHLEEIIAKDGKIADLEYWEKQMSEIDKVSKKSWAEVLKRLADP